MPLCALYRATEKQYSDVLKNGTRKMNSIRECIKLTSAMRNQMPKTLRNKAHKEPNLAQRFKICANRASVTRRTQQLERKKQYESREFSTHGQGTGKTFAAFSES